MQSTLNDTALIQLPRRVEPGSQDPLRIMEAASRRAGKWFASLQQRSHITASQVMDHLARREPKIKARLDALWSAVDGDIYGRYLEGVADAADLRAWRRDLHEWLRLLHAALELVRLHLGEELESDLALPAAARASLEQNRPETRLPHYPEAHHNGAQVAA